MTGLLILMAVPVVFAFGWVLFFTFGVVYARKIGFARKELRGLSWPAKQIVKEYYKLPEANRPYGNILHAVRALDVKHGRDKAEEHFGSRYAGEYHSNWNCGHWRNSDCEFLDYRNLHTLILEIEDSLAKQKHALELAGVEDGLTEAKEIIQRLCDERALINSITKELT